MHGVEIHEIRISNVSIDISGLKTAGFGRSYSH